MAASGARFGTSIAEESEISASEKDSVVSHCAALGYSPTQISALEGTLFEIHASMRDEMQSIRIELIRELELHRQEMRNILERSRSESDLLHAENAQLREEIATLRAPLGLLACSKNDTSSRGTSGD